MYLLCGSLPAHTMNCDPIFQAQASGMPHLQLLPFPAVQKSLEAISLREPRIPTFSGSNGVRYGSANMRDRLCMAVFRGQPSAQHRSRTKVALLQQGYGSFVDLMPPVQDDIA